MFIKRAKSRPSLRARETDDEPTSTSSSTASPLGKTVVTAGSTDNNGDVSTTLDTNNDGTEEESGSVMQRKKAQKKEKKGLSKGSRLSFGGADPEASGGEGSVPFKPKKSLLSQSIKLPSTPQSVSGNGASAASPSSSSIYSSEYLSQLKASTPSRGPKVEVDDDEEEQEQEESGGLSRAAREKFASTFKEDTTAGIPNEAAIAAARMKRQAAVNTAKRGVESEDYISLGGGQIAVWDGEKGPHPESRLMREEDEGDEGDEDMADYTEANDRLFLGKSANKSAARRLKGEIGELIDDREMEDEDDEETREWEEAQARRGGTWEAERPVEQPVRAYAPAPIPVARPLPTIASAQGRIARAIAEIKSTQTQAEHNLDVAVRDLSILEDQERDLRIEVERVEGKREWVEGFRGWVEMLGGFLEEKMPKLEDIEGDAIHHLKQRSEMVNQRRRADDEDDLSLFLGSARPVDAEVDELGRSRVVEAGPSTAVRRARRSERDARRTKRKARAARQDAEAGFSTDSTLAEGDADDYEAAHGDLSKRVKSLGDDVRAEDFRNPELGLAVKFGDWRKRYEEEYLGAFGGLSMVQAWEFYARGEMVGWEPLRATKPLESFDWFHALHAYSHPPVDRQSVNNSADDDDMDLEDEPPLGPDGDLVIEMVQKAVVPLLMKHFEAGAYDPYSTPQTRKAIDLVEVVGDLMGKTSKKYTTLLKAIMAVFSDHIVSLATLVGSAMDPSAIPAPPGYTPEARSAIGRFVRRRVKLMRNILLWRREAPTEERELVNRLAGEVIRPIIERSWETGGRELGIIVATTAGTELRPDLAVFLREGPGHRRAW